MQNLLHSFPSAGDSASFFLIQFYADDFIDAHLIDAHLILLITQGCVFASTWRQVHNEVRFWDH